MPQASSDPRNSSTRRYHPAPQSSRPRRPVHPPPSTHLTCSGDDPEMATVSSSARSYWNPGPYPQPGRSNSVPHSQAPPPHVLPESFKYIPGGPLPQRPIPNPSRTAMDSLADAAIASSRVDFGGDDIPVVRVPPTVTRIQFSEPPPSLDGLPQWPPGSVRKPLNMSFTAPHQVNRERLALPSMAAQEPLAPVSWGIIDDFKNAPPPPRHRTRPADETPFDPPQPGQVVAVPVKRRKRQFGDMPDDDGPLGGGPLSRLVLSRPTSPNGSRAADDWQEQSRRLMHPRSIYSPPSPPRRQLPKIREDAVSRRGRSTGSSANSRDSLPEQSKADSQPKSQSESHKDPMISSQPMISMQGSLESAAPPLVANDSIRTNSTQDSILASPMLPPRPEMMRSRSLHVHQNSSFAGPVNALELNSSDDAPIGMKRRWSGDDSPSKRDISG